MELKKHRALTQSIIKLAKWTGFALIVAITACNTQDIPSHNIKAITEFNTSCMSDSLWTGAVVLAGTADKIVFRQSWGYTSVDKTIELPEDGIFDMASITKPVATATALAICMDRGLVNINAPFDQYLPEYQGELQGTVTVLDLIRHISGFDNSKPYLKFRGAEMIKNLLSNSPVRPPKQKYEYACINYILLGMIVEKVSGELLDKFCKENIFDPLSMQDTRFTPVPKTGRVVKSPFTPEQGVASDNPARLADRPIGNAGLFSSVDDLAKYCRMILGKGEYGSIRVLSEKALQAMSIKPDTCSPLAFGWFVNGRNNPPSLSEATLTHSGWTGNTIWIDPVRQCFIIVLTNRTGNHGEAMDARAELAELVLRAKHKELGLKD